jgi:hypothetical protein
MAYLVRYSLLLVLIAGCNEVDPAWSAQRSYVDRHRDAYVFEGTTHEYVLQSVRSVLADKGFTLRAQPEPDGTYRTNRLVRDKRNSGEFIVRFVDLRWRQGFLLNVTYVRYDGSEIAVSTVRDTVAEWEVIQRADPDRVVDINRKAGQHADDERHRRRRWW